MDGFVNKVIEGDCLEILPKLPDHSVDMILCDLPYGVTKNRWDIIIDLSALWHEYQRILKPKGVIALTGCQKFTGKLIMSNPQWFRYKIVWIKSKATNFLNANRQPLRRHEDICIFYEQQPFYHPNKVQDKPYDKGLRSDNLSGTYNAYKAKHCKNIRGDRYPSDVLFYEEDVVDWLYFKTAESEGGYHPTQKPVDLGRWLIRAFTRRGEIVLDNACGSGSFLIAAVLEDRQFIGIEKNNDSFHFGRRVNYITICNRRINAARSKKQTT